MKAEQSRLLFPYCVPGKKCKEEEGSVFKRYPVVQMRDVWEQGMKAIEKELVLTSGLNR